MPKMSLKKSLERLTTLRGEIEERFIDAGLIAMALVDAELMSASELALYMGYSKRRVYDLIAIARVAKLGLLTRKRAAQLGSTKAGIIAQALLAGTLDGEGVDELADLTAAQLLAAIKGATPGKKIIAFALDPDDMATLRSALSLAGADLHAKGLRNKESALLSILVRAGMATTSRVTKLHSKTA